MAYELALKGLHVVMLQIRVGALALAFCVSSTVAMLEFALDNKVPVMQLIYVGLFGVLLLHDSLELMKTRRGKEKLVAALD